MLRALLTSGRALIFARYEPLLEEILVVFDGEQGGLSHAQNFNEVRDNVNHHSLPKDDDVQARQLS